MRITHDRPDQVPVLEALFPEAELERLEPASVQFGALHEVVRLVVTDPQFMAVLAAVGGGVAGGVLGEVGADVWRRFKVLVGRLRAPERSTAEGPERPGVHLAIRSESGDRTLLVDIDDPGLSQQRVDAMFTTYVDEAWPEVARRVRDRGLAVDDVSVVIRPRLFDRGDELVWETAIRFPTGELDVHQLRESA